MGRRAVTQPPHRRRAASRAHHRSRPSPRRRRVRCHAAHCKDVMKDHLAGLNPEQRAAVEHFEGPILALAGAGSGKTRVLTTRVAHLINEYGVDPSSILAVTFTNKAAAEMRTRIRRLLGRDPAGMWVGTFHSIGARLLRRHAGRLGWTPNFTIYDADEAVRETKRALEKLKYSPKKWNPKAVHGTISSAKNQLVSA